MSKSIPESVKVGDGASAGFGSDSYPYTVIEVNPTGKTIVVQNDSAHATKDSEYYGNQDYTYSRNTTSPKVTYTWRKRHGCYYPKGCTAPRRGGGSGGLYIGERRYYQDPSY